MVATSKLNLQDSVVIYASPDDSCLIAHSLRTDQIGTGESALDALADLVKAIELVGDHAARDTSLAFLREAPKEIQDKVKNAQEFSKETFNVAPEMVLHVAWPLDDWKMLYGLSS